MNRLDKVNQEQMRKDRPDIRIGDTVSVHVRIVEGNKERIQIFKGSVIAWKGSRINARFTVRRISHNVGVERIFPLHSPHITKIDIEARGDVRRAKLYYVRDRIGKAARIKTKYHNK